MRLDTKQALRPVLCLPNPSAMQGARWGEARLDIEQALRPVVCLPNPSRMQAARWERAGFRGACAAPPESKRAATAGSPCGTGRAVGRSQRGHKTSPAAFGGLILWVPEN